MSPAVDNFTEVLVLDSVINSYEYVLANTFFPFLPQGDHNFLYLSEHLRVPKNLYERIAEIADYKKYTSALLMILFDRETLATHSLQGRRNTFTGEDCPKPQLPPEILRSIIGKMASLDLNILVYAHYL